MATRILYLNATGHFAGAEAMLTELVTRLDPRRWQPTVVVPFEGPLSAGLGTAGINFGVRPLAVLRTRQDLRSPRALMRLGAGLPASVVALARLIRKQHVDLVHTNSSVLLDGALAARVAGVPHVWHVRELLSHPGPVWSSLRWLIPALSARVLCVSRAVVRHFGTLPGHLHRRLCIAPDGVAAGAFQGVVPFSWPWPAAVPVVGMVARVNGHKGHQDFLRAAKLVAERFPAARFVVVGGALPAYAHLERGLHLLARDLGLAGRVLFLGQRSTAEVRQALAGMDVFVLPSQVVEGFGVAALEAMAAGLPVVATGGGPEDLVVDGKTGLLVPRGRPMALADAVAHLLAHPTLAEQMGRAGRLRAESDFGIEQHVAAVAGHYEAVLARGTLRS